MTPIIVSITFLLGLIVGSFLNVVIRRGVRHESITGRSYCESCKKILSFKELVPVISYLSQKGKCSNCGSNLSWQYPLIEIGTGAMYALTSWYLLPTDKILLLSLSNESLLAFDYWFLAIVGLSAAIVIFVSDFLYQIIPNGAVMILFLTGLIATFYRESIFKDSLTALAIALILSAFWFFSKGQWMGLGDTKLILATSLILGYPQSISAFLFSFWLGGLMGIFLLLFRLKSRADHIPFGPFILIGSVLAYFFSDFFLVHSNLYPLL